jgi:hypothetical protein
VQREEAQSTEKLLAAAGFKMKLADTLEKRDHLKMMPPLELATRSQDGRVIYSYADPANCQCVYVGGPDEYVQYQQLALKKELADEKLAAARAEEDAALNWGMWSPFWW